MSQENEGSNLAEGQNQDNIDATDNISVDELKAQLESERKSKERILEESKKYKEGFQTFKQKQEEEDKAKAHREEERLKKEGQFNVLLEQRESRINELEEKLNATAKEVESRDTAIVNFKKAGAFERELGGKLKKDAYWNHVDFESIAVNPDTGRIDSHSVKKAADKFLTDFKELVDFGNPANLPNGTASGSAGKLTVEQWKQLPLKERKSRMKDVVHK